MKKVVIAVFSAITVASAQTQAKEEDYKLDNLSLNPVCQQGPTKECRKVAADTLSQLPPPGNDRQRLQLLEDYRMLGMAAQYTGDLADWEHFYQLALKYLDPISPQGAPKEDDAFIHEMFSYDMVAIELSKREYAAALHRLDDFHGFMKKQYPNSAEDDSSILFRAAALTGLGREAEADLLLGSLQQSLNLEGVSPREGFPFGPQPLNPYEAGRRIAAHYLKERRFEDALALLKTLAKEQQKILPLAHDRSVDGKYWAIGLTPEDLMDDQADVYIAQGKDGEAEKILKTSLAGREKKPDWALRNTLEKLSVLEKREGKTKEAAEFSQRAASIVIANDPVPVDPLRETLGLPNSRKRPD